MTIAFEKIGTINKRLGDIVNFKRGYDLPSYDRKDGKYPIISSSGISGYHNDYKQDGEGLVTGRYGTLGEMYYINGKYWPHNTTLYVTDFKGNYPKYVYFLMKSLNSLKKTDKSTVPGIDRNDLHEIEIPYIQPEFQKPIADSLFTLETKISLNTRINAELEQMARTIYNYWFVQFDFPISAAQAASMGKPELEGKPYKASGGEMAWNEELKREVPVGWEVGGFNTLISEFISGDWGKDTLSGNCTEKVTCIRGADIANLTSEKLVEAPTRFIIKKNLDKILGANSLIIEISGGSPSQSTGRIAYINDALLKRLNNKIICSNFCRAIKLKYDAYFHFFFYTWTSAYDAKVLFNYEGKTTGIKNLLIDDFINGYKIPVPEKEITLKYQELIEPMLTKVQKNAQENQELTRLRDFLLPLLMNGEVTISVKG
jgi:type I restriction enzyme S subunit